MLDLPQLQPTRKMVVLWASRIREWFWHLFRLLSHFGMDRCPPCINFTWVRSESKHSQRDYGCLVLGCFGTRPLDIILHKDGTYAQQPPLSRPASTGLRPRNIWSEPPHTPFTAFPLPTAAQACAGIVFFLFQNNNKSSLVHSNQLAWRIPLGPRPLFPHM